MSDNVVGLRGQVVVEAAPPNPELVGLLERLLDMARSGEVQGVLGASLYRDGCTGALYCGVHSFGLVGRAYAMLQRSAEECERNP